MYKSMISFLSLFFTMLFVPVVARADICRTENIKFCPARHLCSSSTFINRQGIIAWSTIVDEGYEYKMQREAIRRGLDCDVGKPYDRPYRYNIPKVIKTPTTKVKTYLQRCSVTTGQVKEAQKYLKELELYPYKIDGIAGKGTLAAIKKAKEMVGDAASKGECITAADIKAFEQLAQRYSASKFSPSRASEVCNATSKKGCTDFHVCFMATKKYANNLISWTDTRFGKRFILEAKRRNLDCRIGYKLEKVGAFKAQLYKDLAGAPNPDAINNLRPLPMPQNKTVSARETYLQRCSVTTGQIKEAQKYLKVLKLYPYKIDGIAGKETLAAIKKVKEMLGAKASAGECISSADIKAFQDLAQPKKCNASAPNFCSNDVLCAESFTTLGGTRTLKHKNNTYAIEAKRRQLSCVSETVCSDASIEECSNSQICERATRVNGEIVSWLENAYSQKAQASGLDCNITRICSEQDFGTCSNQEICERATSNEESIVKWLNNAYTEHAVSLGLDCDVPLTCDAENFENCSNEMVCDKATVLRSGVRSWNFDENAFIERAKDLLLDCEITIDNTPFSKEEAIYYLSKLIDFVTENAGDFDLKFASEFDKVRPITQGEWSIALSKDFELFKVYIANFPSFQKHLEELRLADDAANQKRIEQLRGALSQDMTVLKEWAKANVLDAKAAEIAALDANLGNKSSQDVNALEQLVAETQRLLMATGIKDGPVQQVTQEVVDSLYDPSSIYLFVNTSGDAANVYKNLEGAFRFEQNSGIYCPTEKLGAFDYYLLRDRIFDTFEGLSSVEQDCSRATDIFVVKGNELTTDRVFDVIPLSVLTQVSEFSKEDRDKAYDQLKFLEETIQKDVLDGTRVGFGLLKTDQAASKICAIIDGDEYGHQEQLGQYALLMSALNLQWTSFEKVTSSSEEAFKFLQRNQCDAVYAGSLNLGRLYLAGEVAGITLEFLPVWISKASVEASQKAYDDILAASEKAKEALAKANDEAEKELAKANDEAEQNLKDQAKLDEQAERSAAELAAVRQRELRKQNRLRFMVLRDELQDQVFAASAFGFENPSEETGYIKKYLEQSFVDQITRYSPYDGIIADMQKLAAERWEITEQRLDQMDYGEASFNGRSVDALQVELKIASKNRLVGRYSEYCRRIHAIKDEDFEMWRNFSVTDCSDEVATLQWKLKNAFQSKWIVEPN